MDTLAEPRFIEAPEVARRYGFRDRKAVYHLMTQGLPAYRVGLRRLVFDPAEVEAWIRSRRANPVGAA